MHTTSTFSQIYSSICKSSFCYTYNGACAFHALQVYQPTVKAQCVSAVYRQSVYLLPVQQCFQLQGSLSFVSSPQCKYMNFIYLKSSFITWMVYLDPTHRPAPSWLVSSVGRALHRYRRGHEFKLFSTTGSIVFLAVRIS